MFKEAGHPTSTVLSLKGKLFTETAVLHLVSGKPREGGLRERRHRSGPGSGLAPLLGGKRGECRGAMGSGPNIAGFQLGSTISGYTARAMSEGDLETDLPKPLTV